MTLEIGANLLCAILITAWAAVAWRALSIAIVREQNKAPAQRVYIHNHDEEEGDHERY